MSKALADCATKTYKCNANGCNYSAKMKVHLQCHRKGHNSLSKLSTFKWKKIINHHYFGLKQIDPRYLGLSY